VAKSQYAGASAEPPQMDTGPLAPPEGWAKSRTGVWGWRRHIVQIQSPALQFPAVAFLLFVEAMIATVVILAVVPAVGLLVGLVLPCRNKSYMLYSWHVTPSDRC